VRKQRIVSIIFVVILALMVRSEVCSAQEYKGWVLDPQAMQGIERVLVGWNKGNMSYSAAQWALRRFEQQKLKNVQATLWDGQPLDLGTFDALVVVEAFCLNDQKWSRDIYMKDFISRFGYDSDARYIPVTLTAKVQAAWVTLYLLRVESGSLRSGGSSTPRWLGPIVYINSNGGGGLIFDDPSGSSPGLPPACLNSTLVSATNSLVHSLIGDMKSIDPENWQ
jgi:hypothetical protein